MAVIQPKYISLKEKLYPYLRKGAIIPAILALIFAIDMLLPLKTSSEGLLSQRIVTSKNERHHEAHNKFYWQTLNFEAEVSIQFYNEFAKGNSVILQHTPIFKKIFRIEYTTRSSHLEWRQSSIYYFWIIAAIFVIFSSYTSLRQKTYNDIGFNAAIGSYIFTILILTMS